MNLSINGSPFGVKNDAGNLVANLGSVGLFPKTIAYTKNPATGIGGDNIQYVIYRNAKGDDTDDNTKGTQFVNRPHQILNLMQMEHTSQVIFLVI